MFFPDPRVDARTLALSLDRDSLAPRALEFCTQLHHPAQLSRSRQSLEELSRLPVDRAISGL